MASTRRRHRIALAVFVVVAAAACLALGYWQWSRFESVGGSGRNLGYALQWPLFAAFFIYSYRRFVKLESEHAPELDAEPPEQDTAAQGDTAAQRGGPHAPAASSAGGTVPESSVPEPSAPGPQAPADGRPAVRASGAPQQAGPGRAAPQRSRKRPGPLRHRHAAPVTEIPADLLPQRASVPDATESAPDSTLSAYNDYLARLNERDTKGSRR